MLAVVASADGNTAGYGALNPALYLLAQQSPGTYLNDVTSGNNDYNATDGGQYPAMAGYDMATGLGTPVASELAAGLTGIPLDVVVSGSQSYGARPTFTATANYAGSGPRPSASPSTPAASAAPPWASSTAIGPSLAVGSYTLLASSVQRADARRAPTRPTTRRLHERQPTTSPCPGPVDVAVSGTQTYGGTASFSGTDSPPSGVTVSTAGSSCTKVRPHDHRPDLARRQLRAGARPPAAGPPCRAPTPPGYTVVYTSAAGQLHGHAGPADDHRLEHLHDLRRERCRPSRPATPASSTATPASSLTTKPTCSTTATSGSSPVLGHALRLLVTGRGRPQLHDQLLRGFGDGQHRAADHHRLERRP